MKKLISILVIVAMLLASVLAMIPASAAKTSDTALATYNVNWKSLYDGGKMKAQWCFNASESQNNFDEKFTVEATENSLSVDPINGGDTRQYYSTTMFDITDTTYYEYEFEAKNHPDNPTGSGGVVFAWAIDPDAYKENGDCGDFDGPHYQSAYFLYGELQNESDTGECIEVSACFGYHADDGGYVIGDNSNKYEKTTAVAKITDDGYAKYKVVYDGLNVKIFYLDEEDNFVDLWPNKTASLAEGAKVAFGIYARGKDKTRAAWVRNCVLTAHNYESAAIIEGKSDEVIALGTSIDKAEVANAQTAGYYTPATYGVFSEKLTAAKTAFTSGENVTTAKTDLDAAYAGLKIAADKTELNALIDMVDGALEGKESTNYDATAWENCATALNAAKVVRDNAEAVQDDADTAWTNLYNAIKTLMPKFALTEAIKAYNALTETNYTPDSWADVDAAYTTAAETNANESASEQDIAAHAKALTDAIDALVDRADFSDLEEAIEKAEGLDSANYWPDSWATLATPLANAKTALENKNLSQDDVDSACNTLKNTMDALVGRINVMGDSNADKQFAGTGNVFYYDYHKYITTKGYTVGQAFEMSGNDKGDENFMLRLGNNGGGGTASVCDGIKNDGTFSHNLGDITINGKTYKHAFGYSFKESVTVDSVAFYLPTATQITTIDVYGAVRSEKDGATVYGKEADKVFLGTFTVGAAADGAANIEVAGALSEALKVDYIFFAVSGPTSAYKFYEIELYGVKTGAADFSALKTAIATANSLIETDYTEATWAGLETALETIAPVNKNALSTPNEITAAAATLNGAITALVAKPANKDALNTAITEAEALKEAEYTTDSWKALKDVLTAAKAEKDNATLQSKVDAAKAALDAAVATLVKRGDKTDLKALIEECKALKAEDWQGNEIAWGMFLDGIEDAEALVADVDALDGAIQEMIASLKGKKDDLVATKTTGGEGEGEGEGETETDAPADDAETEAPADDAETEAPADDETEAPKKGGCGSSIALSALAVIGVVGTALVIKKKED